MNQWFSKIMILAIIILTQAIASAQTNPNQNGGSFLSLPTYWAREENPNNPIFAVKSYPNGNLAEEAEQYDPAPVMLPSGEIWVYVKGGYALYASSSSNGGATWTLRNDGQPVLKPGDQ